MYRVQIELFHLLEFSLAQLYMYYVCVFTDWVLYLLIRFNFSKGFKLWKVLYLGWYCKRKKPFRGKMFNYGKHITWYHLKRTHEKPVQKVSSEIMYSKPRTKLHKNTLAHVQWLQVIDVVWSSSDVFHPVHFCAVPFITQSLLVANFCGNV